jgi:hypothetical protein
MKWVVLIEVINEELERDKITTFVGAVGRR